MTIKLGNPTDDIDNVYVDVEELFNADVDVVFGPDFPYHKFAGVHLPPGQTAHYKIAEGITMVITGRGSN